METLLLRTVFLAAAATLAALLFRPGALASDQERLRTRKRTAVLPVSEPAIRLAGVLQSHIDPDIRRALRLFRISEATYSVVWLVTLIVLTVAGLVLKKFSLPAGLACVWAGVFGLPNLLRFAAAVRRILVLRDLPFFLLLLDIYLTRMPLPEAVRSLLPSLKGIVLREVSELLADLEEKPAVEALMNFRARLGVPAAEAAIEALAGIQMEGGQGESILAAQGEKLDELAEAAALGRAKAMPYVLVGGQGLVVIASFLTFALPLFHIVMKGLTAL